MKKYLNYIPNWLLAPILFILFLGLWPLLLIILGLYYLFSGKTTEKEKILGAKIMVVTFLGIIVLSSFLVYQYSIEKYFYSLPWKFIFVFLLFGLLILIILQRLFPNWKLISSTIK